MGHSTEAIDELNESFSKLFRRMDRSFLEQSFRMMVRCERPYGREPFDRKCYYCDCYYCDGECDGRGLCDGLRCDGRWCDGRICYGRGYDGYEYYGCGCYDCENYGRMVRGWSVIDLPIESKRPHGRTSEIHDDERDNDHDLPIFIFGSDYVLPIEYKVEDLQSHEVQTVEQIVELPSPAQVQDVPTGGQEDDDFQPEGQEDETEGQNYGQIEDQTEDEVVGQNYGQIENSVIPKADLNGLLREDVFYSEDIQYDDMSKFVAELMVDLLGKAEIHLYVSSNYPNSMKRGGQCLSHIFRQNKEFG